MGTKNQGRGHETAFKQILHERLGLDPADVRYIDGDTDRVGFGMGTMGSRSTVIGGTALWTAADKVIAKGNRIAAKLLEAAEPDIVFSDGRFPVAGTDRAVTLKEEVARAAFRSARLPAGLESHARRHGGPQRALTTRGLDTPAVGNTLRTIDRVKRPGMTCGNPCPAWQVVLP